MNKRLLNYTEAAQIEETTTYCRVREGGLFERSLNLLVADAQSKSKDLKGMQVLPPRSVLSPVHRKFASHKTQALQGCIRSWQ